MSSPTDSPSRGALYRPAGWAWSIGHLLALAVGLFPGLVLAPGHSQAVPPAMGVLAAVSVAAILLVWPVVMLGRLRPGPAEADSPAKRMRGLVGEMFVWWLLSVPFWAVAAWLGDAGLPDVGRTGGLLAGAWATAWALGLLARGGPGWRSAALLLAVLAALAGPVAVYLALEFSPAGLPAWLGPLFPTTLAWTVAQTRQPAWLPEPLWAWLAWPITLAAVALARTLLPRR